MRTWAIEGKGIIMSVKNQIDYDVLIRVLAGEITGKQAAVLLNKSYRQTKRLIRKVKERGMLGVKHGSLGKVPWNRSQQELKKQVLQLLEEKYFDFNLTHFAEKLLLDHGICVKRETLRKWAHEKHLVKRAHNRAYRKPKLHRTRHRMPKAGMLLQMDGSSHRWMGPRAPEACLVGGIDDATSICPYGEFFPAEDTIAVLSVLKRTVMNVGIPEVLYVDQASHFGKANTRFQYLDWEKHLTHVERAMAELGCRVLFAPSPQAKGRIERMWNTFQDRLIPELRIRNVQRIPTANYFLQNHFIPEFNHKWSKIPSNPNSSYQPIPKHLVDSLDDIFCIREWRKVSPGESITWNAQTFIVHHNFRHSIRGLQVELRTRLDGTWSAFYANRPIDLKPFQTIKKISA